MKKIAILAALTLCLCLTACGKKENKKALDLSSVNNDSSAASVYDTGIEMSDDIYDFTFRIDDNAYELPISIEAFTKTGWKFKEYFDDYEKGIDSDHIESFYLTKGKNELSFQVFNMTGVQKKFKDCPIGRVEYEFNGDIQFYIANDFLLNDKKLSEIKEKFGTPNFNEDYGNKIQICYEKENADSIYERYTMEFDGETEKISRINIVNFVETEKAENDNSDTAYLSNYKAPMSLGNEPNNFNVSVMGDLYNLPAPVSEFQKNGWEIVKSCDVGAGTYSQESLVMKKNGVTAEFGVYNFSKNQVDAADAAVYKIDVSSYENKDVKLELPSSISLGTSAADVEKALKNYSDFEKENSVNNSTTYRKNERQSMISIYLDDSRTVESITIFRKECPYK